MPDLMELAERCERAEGPDRELDAAIHLALFGGKTGAELGLHHYVAELVYYRDPETGHGLPYPFKLTGSVEVAELTLPGPEWPEWQITRRYCTGYHANVGLGADGVGCCTPALALVAAALRARAAEEGEGR